MKNLLIPVLLASASLAQATTSTHAQPLDQICLAGTSEGALGVVMEQQADLDAHPVTGAEVLLRDCGGQTLLQVLLETQQAENLEYAVIDMGVDVNAPLVREEGGLLTLTQYLMQQAAVGRTAETRAFALEYMQNFRDGDFNPNLYTLSMN